VAGVIEPTLVAVWVLHDQNELSGVAVNLARAQAECLNYRLHLMRGPKRYSAQIELARMRTNRF
jgi:hypothetical protein